MIKWQNDEEDEEDILHAVDNLLLQAVDGGIQRNLAVQLFKKGKYRLK